MKILTKNKRAFFDFEFSAFYTAGIVLLGAEVKSIKSGKCKLESSHAIIRGGEIFIIGMSVQEYKFSQKKIDPQRTRKLLLKKSEIERLSGKLQDKGQTLIPTKIFLERGFVKIEFGLGKAKKKWDKREDQKKKQADKDARSAVKNLRWE